MCVAQPELVAVSCTGREKQQNNYSRNGKTETITVRMRAPREFRDPQGAGWMMAATETVEDTGPGTAKIDLEFTSPSEANIGGAFLGIELPAAAFSGGSVQLIEPDPPTAEPTSLAAGVAEQNEYLRATAKGARFVSRTRQIEVTFNEPTLIVVRDDRRKGSYDLQVLLAVLTGKTTAGQTGKKSFAFKVTGEIDKDPVEITLDASHPGQMFDGLGGNFRLQNARIDPQVIDYNLKNLRIAWGRVEMPWSLWHPDENTDPLAAARAGNVHPRVQQAMGMARRLAQKGTPVIVSAWQAPSWAILGEVGGRRFAPGGATPPGAPARGDAMFGPPPQDGPRGNPLNPEKMDRIQDSSPATCSSSRKNTASKPPCSASTNPISASTSVKPRASTPNSSRPSAPGSPARVSPPSSRSATPPTPTPSTSSSPPCTIPRLSGTSARWISTRGGDAPTRSSPSGAMPPAS